MGAKHSHYYNSPHYRVNASFNFWHDLSALTDQEIAGVKKIGKLSILSRNKGSVDFINTLDEGISFFGNIEFKQNRQMLRP